MREVNPGVNLWLVVYLSMEQSALSPRWPTKPEPAELCTNWLVNGDTCVCVCVGMCQVTDGAVLHRLRVAASHVQGPEAVQSRH